METSRTQPSYNTTETPTSASQQKASPPKVDSAHCSPPPPSADTVFGNRSNILHNSGEHFELLRAFYDYDCIWTELEDPDLFFRLSKEDSGANVGFVLGIIREHNGHPVICHRVSGDDRSLQHFAELEARRIKE